MITPVAKKRGAVKVEEHRGITLLSTAYKVYASVLANKIKERERKKSWCPKAKRGSEREEK